MSAFSHTDWTVICDGKDREEFGGDSETVPCGRQGRTDVMDSAAVKTASDVRRVLKARGWLVSVLTDRPSGPKRLDFCPVHKIQYTHYVPVHARRSR